MYMVRLLKIIFKKNSQEWVLLIIEKSLNFEPEILMKNLLKKPYVKFSKFNKITKMFMNFFKILNFNPYKKNSITNDYTFFYLEIRINKKLCIKCFIISTHNSILINTYIKKYLLVSSIFISNIKYKLDSISYPKPLH